MFKVAKFPNHQGLPPYFTCKIEIWCPSPFWSSLFQKIVMIYSLNILGSNLFLPLVENGSFCLPAMFLSDISSSKEIILNFLNQVYNTPTKALNNNSISLYSIKKICLNPHWKQKIDSFKMKSDLLNWWIHYSLSLPFFIWRHIVSHCHKLILIPYKKAY